MPKAIRLHLVFALLFSCLVAALNRDLWIGLTCLLGCLLALPLVMRLGKK